jgi:hyaluronoglucosaminidase
LHHEQIEADVNRVIPNETFDGLAIIDYEAWRPIYDLNHSSRKVYQRYSEDLIAKRCENCTEEQLRDMARLSFELAAK